jgi:amphiphysin
LFLAVIVLTVVAQVDYERYKSRVDGLQIKQVRSDRDNTALAKHQADMARASTEYEYADESLRMQLPKLNAATFSILPLLLANQIVLQNNLIGNLYTVLSQYSREQGYPDPPLDPEEVASIWDANFTPLRKEIESEVRFLKEGKAIHLPMRQEGQGSTLTGLGLRNRVMPGRRTSGNSGLPSLRGTSPRPGHTLPSTAEDGPPPYLASKPSLQSLNASKPRYGAVSPGLSPSPGPDAWGPRRTSTASHASSAGLSAPNGHSDYFDAKPRIASAASSASSANPAAGKKKPPPPPPKKVGSFHSEFVTAMYDFDGQSAGDLVFREGDRIRVIKKTNNSQDWWEGELRGQKGSFPANYCK